MNENCEVDFAEDNEFIIVSDFAILKLIQVIQEHKGCSEINIFLEELIPSAYVQYIERVINVNRYYHQAFNYEYISHNPIGEADILIIFAKQVKLLTIDNILCFKDVIITSKNSKKSLNLKINLKWINQVFTSHKNIIIKQYY